MRYLATVLLLLATATVAAEKAAPAQHGRDKRAAALLAALNSGDAIRIRGFVEQNYAAGALQQRPAAERAVYLQLYAETQGWWPISA